MSYIHTDLPNPGRFSLGRVAAARKGHATRRRVADPMVCPVCNTGQRGQCDCLEMAVYDPSDDDLKPPMTGANAVLLVVAVILSACFSAWVLCTFSAQIKAVLGLL